MTAVVFRHVASHPLCLAAFATAVVSLAAASAVTVAVWRPAAAREAAASGEAARLGDRLRALRDRTRMAEEYAARERDVEALEAKLKSGRDAPELVRDLEALAEKSGAALLQFSSRKAPKEAAGVETTLFEFVLKGPYPSLKGFLAALGRLPEFIVVERAVFERLDPDVRVRMIVMRRAAAGA